MAKSALKRKAQSRCSTVSPELPQSQIQNQRDRHTVSLVMPNKLSQPDHGLEMLNNPHVQNTVICWATETLDCQWQAYCLQKHMNTKNMSNKPAKNTWQCKTTKSTITNISWLSEFPEGALGIGALPNRHSCGGGERHGPLAPPGYKGGVSSDLRPS